MARYGMVIDLDRCVGCLACVAACKEEWDTPTGSGQNRVHCLAAPDSQIGTPSSMVAPGVGRDWVYCVEALDDAGRPRLTFYPGLCNHCDENPCIEACPTAATYKDPDGIVLIDPDLCIGCGYCIPACPYGARYRDELRGKADKCTFCRPRVDRGEEPACVTTCLADCRYFGDLEDPGSPASRVLRERGAQGLESPEVALKPNVLYVGPEHRDRIRSAGVPGPYALPRPGRLWDRLLDPLTKVAVVGGLLGVAGATVLNRLAERRARIRAADEGGEDE